jgi:hypothetical protein
MAADPASQMDGPGAVSRIGLEALGQAALHPREIGKAPAVGEGRQARRGKRIVAVIGDVIDAGLRPVTLKRHPGRADRRDGGPAVTGHRAAPLAPAGAAQECGRPLE